MRWRFADKVLAFAPWQAIVTLKAGSLEEYSLLDRWGSPGQAPAILTLEACIQSARWLVEASSAFSQTIEPLEISRWQVMAGLRPGERLRVRLRVTSHSAERIGFHAWQDRLLPGQTDAGPGARPHAADEPDMDFSAALTPLAGHCLPADRACSWRELTA